MSKRKIVSCGLDLTCVPDLPAALESAGQCGFEFVSAPLVHPRYKREFVRIMPKRPGPLTRSDKVLLSSDWCNLIVAKLSPWIELDSPNETVRRNSEKAFFEEMSLAMHVNVPAILIELKSSNCVNLSRCLNHFLRTSHNCVFWIHIPMKDPKSTLDSVCEEEAEKAEDTWEWWNKLRMLCDNNGKLAVALEVCDPPTHFSVLQRWCCEPLRLAILPTDVFLLNKKGFPVLSRCLQGFLVNLFKLDAQLLLTGASKVEYGIQTYQQYLNHLYQFGTYLPMFRLDALAILRNQPTLTNIEMFSKGYEDFLQTPLQPLMDNLDSQTYEIFERDPIKYVQYEKAVAKALVDRVGEEQKDEVTTVIMVVGAGRGPLVDASLKAALSVNRRVMIYAVEKNPGAVVTLLNRQAEEWGNKVSVVSCDMRVWEAPEKADILVSELLGSFGDNELSPECLDGAQSFLKPGGISIPCSYTSYLAPLSSPKLHIEVANCKEKDKSPPVTPYETPFVVRLQNATTLCEPVPCFTFTHPNNDTPVNNERYKCLRFEVKESHILHGFAGYFDTVLYDDLTLSIVPKTHSVGMISWFPIYFPIKDAMYIPSCSEVELHIWRLCTDKKVWYEWCVTEPQITSIHNPRGRSYWIGL